MLVVVSQGIVVVLGCAVLVMSAWGIFAPDKLMTMVNSVLMENWGVPFGVIIRLILGAALLVAAPESLFPTVFYILGWVAIAAAVALIIMGQENVRKIISWFEKLAVPMIRLWLLFGMAFGGFLVYGNW